jgi:D-alanyl-D-alanine carboxypeptidase
MKGPMMTRKTLGWRRVLTAIALVGVVVGVDTDTDAVPVAQAAQQSTGGLTEALRNDLQSYLDAYHARDRFTAVALRVTRPNHRPATSVNVSTGRPVPENALWQIGSNTKAFTSVVLLQL